MTGISLQTELIADRVWRSRAQVELATVAWVAWFNHDRLHSSLGDIPPVEYEQRHAAAIALQTRRASTVAVDFEVNRPISPASALALPTRIRSGRDNGSQGTNGRGWPLRPEVEKTYSLTGT